MRDYIGSVRFFKNLILLVVFIMIAVPTGLCIHWKAQFSQSERSIAQLQEESAQLSAQLTELTALQNASCEAAPEEPASQAQSFVSDAPAYQSYYPDFYAPEPIPQSVRTDGVIYLTFDDGPSARTACLPSFRRPPASHLPCSAAPAAV